RRCFWWTVFSYEALSLDGLPHGSSAASHVATAGVLVECGFLWGHLATWVASWKINCPTCDYDGISGGLWFLSYGTLSLDGLLHGSSTASYLTTLPILLVNKYRVVINYWTHFKN
ncbi:hypothetical protein AVEN_169623-1, partial [Araneus ventricosus]